MKKVLLSCLLIVGLNSISVVASPTHLNGETNMNLEDSRIENKSSLALNRDFYNIRVLDVTIVSCTYNVYKNGVFQKSFTSSTCEGAMHAACLFIMSQGGTCPIGY